jgi:hypothetical protein
MGYMGAITGFNDSKIFAAIVDSPTGVTYTSQGKDHILWICGMLWKQNLQSMKFLSIWRILTSITL